MFGKLTQHRISSTSSTNIGPRPTSSKLWAQLPMLLDVLKPWTFVSLGFLPALWLRTLGLDGKPSTPTGKALLGPNTREAGSRRAAPKRPSEHPGLQVLRH